MNNNDSLYWSMLDLIAAFTSYVNEHEIGSEHLSTQVGSFFLSAGISFPLAQRLLAALEPLTEPL